MNTIPQSIEAERSVLGQIMAGGPQVAGEVIGSLLEQDHFFNAGNHLIFGALIESYYADEAMDALSIGERLAKPLAKAWGVSEDEAITGCRNMAAGMRHQGDVTDHAAIVKREFDRRELLEVAASITKMVQAEEKTPEEIGGIASADAMRIATSSLLTHDIVSFGDAGRNFIVRSQKERALRQQGVELGAYFGLDFIDDWTAGLRPTELLFSAGEPGVGKLLALDTLLPSPNGWTTMGEVKSGDLLWDEKGQPTLVTGISDVQTTPSYAVKFAGGSVIEAGPEHQWTVVARTGDDERIRTLRTDELAWAFAREEADELAIEVAEPLSYGGDEIVGLPLDPYVLGLWLARGSDMRLALEDDEVLGVLRERGVAFKVWNSTHHALDGRTLVGLHGVGQPLREAGVWHHKHVPVPYRHASIQQRRDLLAGFADGIGRRDGEWCELKTADPHLRDGLRQVVASLGNVVHVTETRAGKKNRRRGVPRWTIRFQSERSPFYLPSASADWTPRTETRHRITGVELTGTASEKKCVSVASPSHLYLAGECMIPTHNSSVWWTAGIRFAERQSARRPDQQIGTLILSLEMGREPSEIRVAQTLTQLNGRSFREATFSDGELQKVKSEWGRRKDIPLYFNHASTMKASQIRALCVEAIRRYNVGLVIIDHFRYFDMDRPFQNKNDEDDAKVRFLKEGLAKDLNLAVICIAHTVKTIETEDGRPTKKHLRGSGQISADADLVSFVYRPYMYASDRDKDDGEVRETDAELIWDKNRHQPPGAAEFYFEPSSMTVRDYLPGRR